VYSRPIVPAEFMVPQRVDGPGFHLRQLKMLDAEKDFEAVMASAAEIAKTWRPTSQWPAGLTLEVNRMELGWHQVEFDLRHSFAYTVMNGDESQCLGCCYIYPSSNPSYEVTAHYWARTSDLDVSLGKTFRSFLAEQWPFKHIAFPGREQAWSEW